MKIQILLQVPERQLDTIIVLNIAGRYDISYPRGVRLPRVNGANGVVNNDH